MQISLTGKQVDIGDRLRKHVEEGILNSVNKYFPAPISCTVAFSKEGEEFLAEVTVHPAKNIVLKWYVNMVKNYHYFCNYLHFMI